MFGLYSIINLKSYNMKRSKDLFREMMEDLFFGDPWRSIFNKKQKKMEELEYENFEIEKKGVKTKFSFGFDEKGLVKSIEFLSDYTPTPEESQENQLQLLQKQLDEAVEKEDYKLAAELQAKIRETNKITN